jgi:hypothetical protein
MFIRFLDKGGEISLDYNSKEVEIAVTDKDGKAVAVKLDYDEVYRLELTIEALRQAMVNA